MIDRQAQDDAGLRDEGVESLTAAVADEFTERLGRGERPEVEDYVRRYPRIAGVLREVLPALRLMHESGSGMFGSAGGGAPPAARDAVSGRLGDYRIVREVGRGGMGIVYEAEQISLGRRVALKVLPFAAALDNKQLERFKREAQSAAHLHHTNIVPVYSVGCERGVYYYAMQYIEGKSLAEVVAELQRLCGLSEPAEHAPPDRPADRQPDRQADEQDMSQAAGRLVIGDHPLLSSEQTTCTDTDPPTVIRASHDLADDEHDEHHGASPGPPAACASAAPPQTQVAFSTQQSMHGPAFFRSAALLGLQAAEALEHAHSLGIVHRDVKPANLLIDARAHLWVTDFGLARHQADVNLTRTGDMIGTLRYMSPEQALGHQAVVDHRTDIYSLGATLYELLTLRPVWNGRDRRELLRQIAFDEPARLRHWNRRIPTDLETIVLKSLAREPAERYASAADMADDLRRFLEDKPIRAKKPTWPERVAKWARRHRTVVASGVALLAMAVVALSVVIVVVARANRETSLINEELAEQQAQLAQKQSETESALAAEALQRARAQENFEQAQAMLDEFVRVFEEDLPDTAEVGEVRRKLLENALRYYQEFLKHCGDDPAAQSELAASLFRLASIFNEIGAKPDAYAAYELAREVQEKLAREYPNDSDIQIGLFSIYRHLGILRGSGHLWVLSQSSVQEHLRLSPEQAARIDALSERLAEQRKQSFDSARSRRDRSRDEAQIRQLFERQARETEQSLAETLAPAQLHRLEQISLQLRGTQAFSSPDVAEALALTDAQQATIRKIKENAYRSLRETFRGAEGGSPAQRRILEASRRSTNAKLLGVLSPAQMARWLALAGEPFNGELRFDYRWSRSGSRGRHPERQSEEESPSESEQRADRSPEQRSDPPARSTSETRSGAAESRESGDLRDDGRSKTKNARDEK